jgi:hypothetical protein
VTLTFIVVVSLAVLAALACDRNVWRPRQAGTRRPSGVSAPTGRQGPR